MNILLKELTIITKNGILILLINVFNGLWRVLGVGLVVAPGISTSTIICHQIVSVSTNVLGVVPPIWGVFFLLFLHLHGHVSPDSQLPQPTFCGSLGYIWGILGYLFWLFFHVYDHMSR